MDVHVPVFTGMTAGMTVGMRVRVLFVTPAVSRERGSSRVWRRLTDDQLGHPIPCTIEIRRRTRIETLGTRLSVYCKGLDTVLAASLGECESVLNTEHFNTTPPGPTRPTLTRVSGG